MKCDCGVSGGVAVEHVSQDSAPPYTSELLLVSKDYENEINFENAILSSRSPAACAFSSLHFSPRPCLSRNGCRVRPWCGTADK